MLSKHLAVDKILQVVFIFNLSTCDHGSIHVSKVDLKGHNIPLLWILLKLPQTLHELKTHFS